jgi:hypothetical protein
VEKERRRTNKEIEDVYDTSITKSLNMNKMANQRAVEIYNTTFAKVKNSANPLPALHFKLALAYMSHVIKEGTSVPFGGSKELNAWIDKAKGTEFDKLSTHVDHMCQKIHRFIDKRDSGIKLLQSDMIITTEQMSVKQGLLCVVCIVCIVCIASSFTIVIITLPPTQRTFTHNHD